MKYVLNYRIFDSGEIYSGTVTNKLKIQRLDSKYKPYNSREDTTFYLTCIGIEILMSHLHIG